MLGIISMVAFNLIDTYFVGQLGTEELAALSFTFPVIMFIFSIVQGLGIGATALISRSIGQKNREKAARETTDSLALAIAITGVFVIIGVLTTVPTFRLLGAEEELIPLIESYISVWYYALLFVTIPFVGNSAIRAVGDPRTPSMIMIFAVIVNAILDPILIFGLGPIEPMGLRGAAIATAISRGMTMVLSLYILRFREKLITFKIPSKQVLFGCWQSILYIAIPSGLSRMVVPLATGIITAILASYGPAAVAGYGVGTRIEFLASSILFALAASIGPFVGQNLGNKNLKRIEASITQSNRFSLLYGLAVWALLWLFARPIATVFTDDPMTIEVVEMFLKILPAGFGLQGVLSIVNSYLNTIDRPIPGSLIIVVQMLVIGVPSIYLGGMLLQTQGVFVGLAATYIVGGIISLLYHYRATAQLRRTFQT